jgi:DNA-binding MarR family transcriptional regulator
VTRAGPRPASRTPAGDSTHAAHAPDADAVEALLAVSRVLVGLAARSVADLDADITLPQYRVLVILASRGPQRVVDISAELGLAPSTGTRLCDRLVRKRLIRRTRSPTDRRAVRLSLTTAGRALVQRVIRTRRAELSRIVAALPDGWPPAATDALLTFASAAGETPESQWWLGWAPDQDEAR